MFYNITPQVASTLNELGFPYTPDNTLHSHWHIKLADSPLVSKTYVDGDNLIIEFVDNVLRFKPEQFSEELSNGTVIVADYVPIFNKLSFEAIQKDYGIRREMPNMFHDDNVGKYLTLMQRISEYRARLEGGNV